VDFLAKPVPFDRLRSLLAYLEDQAVPGDGARRRVPRLAAPITLRLAYEVEWAAIDLSPFGVKVPLQAWLQPGATVSLTFPLPDGRAPLRLQAVLVRTDPDGHLLSFVNLSDADFRRLVDFCRGVTSDGEAMFRLGLAYEFGKGLARDPGAAVRWYRRAASQGYERAAQRLRALGHDAEAEG
jgi:TPR repeat protein